MDLSIFNRTPQKGKWCLKTLQYLVKQLLNKFNVEISDAEEPPAFQHFMNMHNLKKHNKPECIPACEIMTPLRQRISYILTSKNFHPRYQVQKTICLSHPDPIAQ
jgi:hypothetical protein